MRQWPLRNCKVDQTSRRNWINLKPPPKRELGLLDNRMGHTRIMDAWVALRAVGRGQNPDLLTCPSNCLILLVSYRCQIALGNVAKFE